MSDNPFARDRGRQAMVAALTDRIGARVAADVAVAARTGPGSVAANMGGVVARADAEALLAEHGLPDIEMLMLLALPAARKFARPPISDFFVGAIGLERGTGNLVLGGNMEFPGTHLGLTVHGEGFLATRSFSRGTALSRIALGEAHPCAHCRQYLSEFAASRDLVLIDLLGHRLTLAELYPWPFDPAYLGETGAAPGTVERPDLMLATNTLPSTVATALLEVGRRAHGPYSRCPGAVVLTLRDGNLIAGAAIESVAFNPTMPPLPAALIDLAAHGYAYDDIAAAALATPLGGAVDYSRTTAELLAAVAPHAPLEVVGWKQ